ncbi:MAG TPA: hypothetical protein VLW45_12165, partial [Pelomicrobium sp.]|nr:hypothetical protein [Pelomicrobium sp.]
MTRASARLVPLRLRLTRPLATATGEFLLRESVILEFTADDGTTGVGEAAPWPGFGEETIAASTAVLERALPLLHGANLEPAQWPLDLVMLLADAPAAHAAVEGALCDLAARRAGQPLAAFLQAAAGVPAGGT